MSLADRIRHLKTPLSVDEEPVGEETSAKLFFQNAKFYVHQKLVDRLDYDALNKLPQEEARKQVGDLVRRLISDEKIALNSGLQNELVKEVLYETFGLGPLEPLLEKSNIDEILVNGPNKVYVEQYGKLTLTNVTFKDENHLRHVINRIVSAVGRRIDESCPMVDARLADGSRINAIIPPLALDGPCLSIRRFKKTPMTSDDFIQLGSMNEKIRDYLKLAVEYKLNILISGGTGSGKTTLLNVASRFIPDGERILTIEDAAELQLQQPHVVRLETRPSNIEGKGLIAQRDLVRNALRMRPDRIIVGEVRGEEALDMLQAMNTGHEGSITTVHANTPRDALSRIETMVLMGNSNLTHLAITRQIASAFHMIIQIKRCADGTRKISSMTEVLGMESDVIVLQEIAKYDDKGFVFPPIRPRFLNKIGASQ